MTYRMELDDAALPEGMKASGTVTSGREVAMTEDRLADHPSGDSSRLVKAMWATWKAMILLLFALLLLAAGAALARIGG